MFIRVRDSHFRSILKAVSWRITGSIDTFVLSFIFTGSVKVAGSIAGAENDPLLSSRKSLVRHSLGSARTNCWRVQFALIPLFKRPMSRV
jgi:hypothetical protein